MPRRPSTPGGRPWSPSRPTRPPAPRSIAWRARSAAGSAYLDTCERAAEAADEPALRGLLSEERRRDPGPRARGSTGRHQDLCRRILEADPDAARPSTTWKAFRSWLGIGKDLHGFTSRSSNALTMPKRAPSSWPARWALGGAALGPGARGVLLSAGRGREARRPGGATWPSIVSSRPPTTPSAWRTFSSAAWSSKRRPRSASR